MEATFGSNPAIPKVLQQRSFGVAACRAASGLFRAGMCEKASGKLLNQELPRTPSIHLAGPSYHGMNMCLAMRIPILLVGKQFRYLSAMMGFHTILIQTTARTLSWSNFSPVCHPLQ